MLVFLFLLITSIQVSAEENAAVSDSQESVPISETVETPAVETSISSDNASNSDSTKNDDNNGQSKKLEEVSEETESKSEETAVTNNFVAMDATEEEPEITSQSTNKQLLPDAEKSSGSLNYEYPIVVPLGRNNMQPDLKLTYNNQGIEEGSIFGAGWNLNIPYIERINRKGSDKLYTENYFNSSLSGELILTSGNEWGAKVDNGEFLKYEFINNVWIVTDKEGTTYKFGSASASRQDDPNDSTRIYKWMLEEIRDTNNNYIRYEYFKDAGQIYPSRIVYTGNGTTDGIFEVNFLREARSDNSAQHKIGFGVVSNYRINEINIKINGNYSRKYAISYGVGANGSRSILSSVTETGYDESGVGTTLPATNFEYQNQNVGFVYDNLLWDSPQSPLNYNYDSLLDFNGDGLLDIITLDDDINYFFVNDGQNWVEDVSWDTPYLEGQGHIQLRPNNSSYTDVNGDGLTDIIWGNSSQIFINNGNNWTYNESWHMPQDASSNNPNVYLDIQHGSDLLTDINGDGLTDILATIDNYTYTYINNGQGWTYYDNNWSMPPLEFEFGNVVINSYSRVVDVNGDNLSDIVYVKSGSTHIYINNGHGWSYDSIWIVPMSLSITGSDRFLDVNGDGLIDLSFTRDDHTNFYLNNGHGWILDTSWFVPRNPYDNGVISLGSDDLTIDINGDGLSDLLCSERSNFVFINVTPKVDSLIQFTNSKGGTTDVEYTPSAQYANGGSLSNPELPMTLETVSKITTSDGFGNSFSTEYKYEGGEYYFADAFDRKFAGFAKVTATDDAGNKTISYYHQGNETDSSKGEYDDHISKSGKAYLTENTDSSGNIYSRTINKWDRFDLGNGRSFVKQITKLEMEYNGDSSHLDSAEEYVYDDSTGNLTQKIERGEVNGNNNGNFTNSFEGEDRITTYGYVSNTQVHVLGLISSVVVSDYLGDHIKEDLYYYDGEALGYATKGNQVSHEVWAWWEGGYMNEQKAYDETYGTVVAIKNFKDNWTNYVYDAYHLYPATITNPLNQTESFLYDYSSGQVKQKTDANGRVFQKTYDGLDRLLTEKQPDLTTPSTLVTKTAYVYTDTPLAVSVQKTDYLSSTLTANAYTYFDGLGRKIQERKQGETSYEVKDFAYNNLDLLQKESLPYFSTGTAKTAATTTTALYVNYVYDPMYRIIQTVDAAGTVLSGYGDWRVTITDRNGKQKNIYKDCYGRISAVDEILSGNTYTTYYEYDGLNDLTRITDAVGNVRNFAYDPMGRRRMAEDLHSENDTTFGVWWYEYDENSNLTATYDPKGQFVAYAYDALNRVLTEDYEGQAGIEVTYAYDSGINGIGRLTSITTPAYTETRTYNALGLIASETKTIGGSAYITSYTYDRQGNQLTITNPDNSIIKYEYVTGGLLNKVSRKESTATSYAYVVSNFDYSPTEQITLVNYYNGMKTTNTYDAAKLYRLSTKVTNIASSAKGQSLAYTYDNNGNITRIVDSSVTSSKKTVNYTYDDLNRLLSATATGVAIGQTPYTENYTYDAIGNLTSKTGQGTYVYAGNQGDSFANPHAVTSIGSTTLTYDQNGNLLTKGTALTNTWDYQNRLTQSISGAVTDTYTYDASGQRLSVSNGTIITKYPTKFYNTDGTTPTKHIFANSLEIGTITGTGTSAIIHYTATDHLTGSNLTTNSSDIKEELLDYMPFGTIRIDEKSGTYSDQRKYAGSEYDSDTGLNYMNARYYDGAMGRFISQDPAFLELSQLETQLIDPQSWNSYAYARNNPMKYVDPSGQFWDTVIDIAFTGYDVTRYGKGWATALAGTALVGIGEVTNNQRITNKGDAKLSQGVQTMKNTAGDLAIDAIGTAIPFVPAAGIKASKWLNIELHGISIVDRGRTIYKGSVNLTSTVNGIEKGVLRPRSYKNCSVKTYLNREGHSVLDYSNGNQYYEYNVINSGAPVNTTERVLRGTVKGDMYYSSDHYKTLTKIKK